MHLVETYPDRSVPDGLVCLYISPSENLAEALETPTAQRLVEKGAGLYLMKDGKTSVLSINRPTHAFAKAVCVRDLDPPEAA